VSRPGVSGTRNEPADAGRLVAQATGVSKRYGSTIALEDAGIAIAEGTTHALVGRNGAGKSTLVSLLTGLQAPDAGEVTFAGEPAPPLGDRDGWRERVACVYQKSTIIPTLTVAENLYLNRQGRDRGGLISWRGLRRTARDLLAEWSVDVDVRRPAADLTVEQRQLVEIARALSFGARFVILDEPTAQLDGTAIARLFERIRTLQGQGVTFLFISHHLQEVYEICDTVTVYRDAHHILTRPVAGLPKDELVDAMTGEAARLTGGHDARSAPAAAADVVLRVEGLADADVYARVGFTVRAGEIVGLAGSAGSGKLGVAERIVGLRGSGTGSVEVCGVQPRPNSVPAALAAGVALVPQDRHREGLVPLLSIAENATMTVPGRLGRAGFIDPRRRDRLARELIEQLSIKTPGPELPVSALSGGNQQKVVMARALASEPKLLVLIAPTAGVDVRSKETLLEVVEQASRRGTGVLIVSDELDDLRACDRVLVMFQGRVVGEFPAGWRDGDLVAAMEGVDDA
jgi:simple sugar transport system ATP-binding protein